MDRLGNYRPLKFLIAGGLAAATEFLSFVSLNSITDKVLFSNTTSFLCGLVVSFALNKKWVFNIKGHGKSQFVKYAVVASANLILSNIIIGILVYNLNIAEGVSKVVVMAVIAAWNYLIFSKFIFNKAANDKKSIPEE